MLLCAENYCFYHYFWSSTCLKLETVHKVIKSKKLNLIHICDYGVMVVVGDISIIPARISKLKSNIHQRNIITLNYTANKLLQSGLERNKYNNNKSLNLATVNYTVHYATLQNTELTIYHLSGNYSTSQEQDQILSRMDLQHWQVYTGLI